MIISTRHIKPMSATFLLFNFVVFWVLKFSVIDKITNSMPLAVIILVIGLSAIFTSIMYILIDLHAMRKYEDKVIRVSKYIEEYGCNVFNRCDIPYILKFKKGLCFIYLNSMFVIMNHRDDMGGYIDNLRQRFEELNKIDILVIYSYKYITTVLMSILLFTVWQICSGISVVYNIFVYMIIVLIVAVLAVFIFQQINKYILTIITKIMKKRNLDFFLCKIF